MRQKRAKAYKKQMTVYTHTFKFREPFQTVVDDELVLNCEKAQFDIQKGLDRTIQGETKPMITQCCMQALYDSKNQRAIDVAKEFERRRCNHREPIDPKECIESVVNIEGQNKHRYIIASQNYDLRKALRKVPGIPIVFMNRSVMVMEPLSEATARFSDEFERRKLTAGLNDAKKAGKLPKPAKEPQQAETTEAEKSKKRKGPKQPNPLSIKKKKVVEQPKAEKPKPKRKRAHKKNENGEENANEKDTTEENSNETPQDTSE